MSGGVRDPATRGAAGPRIGPVTIPGSTISDHAGPEGGRVTRPRIASAFRSPFRMHIPCAGGNRRTAAR